MTSAKTSNPFLRQDMLTVTFYRRHQHKQKPRQSLTIEAFLCSHLDLNQGPTDYESATLTD